MKKLIAVVLLISCLQSFAQDKQAPRQRGERAQMEQMTPEQKNALHVKMLTLKLDLSTAQQKDFTTLLSEKSAKRNEKIAKMKEIKATGKKPTSDQKYAFKAARLDEQIAFNSRVKSILNPAQFEKWEKMKENRKQRHGRSKRHGGQRRG